MTRARSPRLRALVLVACTAILLAASSRPCQGACACARAALPAHSCMGQPAGSSPMAVTVGPCCHEDGNAIPLSTAAPGAPSLVRDIAPASAAPAPPCTAVPFASQRARAGWQEALAPPGLAHGPDLYTLHSALLI